MTLLLSPPASLRDLLPTTFAIGAMPISAACQELPPAERVLVSNSIDKRQREFATGRVLARSLLREIGLKIDAIGRREDRTPMWPPGVVGSISHCDDLCVVAVGRDEAGIRSIGIDVEPASPLPRELWKEIACEEELSDMAAEDCEMGLAVRRLFSAKEAYYKCIYPLAPSLGFHDVKVHFSSDVERATFSYRVLQDCFDHSISDSFVGRQISWSSWIVSAFLWRRSACSSPTWET